ncbi:MAG: LLM class flavin-dependent oxidoreductase [Gammaproteobacteria bacterium]
MRANLRHGAFVAPFHQMHENPSLCLRRDFELVEHMDGLGFHEAWIGEHHSAGFETIASPELFIAAAAERTRHIRLGTGVVSLPYHHPLMVANRIVQLDHQTQGRVMFGVGPGLLASDALMLGIDPTVQRDRMAQALDAILRLMAGETVTETTDWYTLREARVHLLPYTRPSPEVAVASAVTPSGARVAGRYGLGMLCVAATDASGFSAMDSNWAIAREIAAEHGQRMEPARLRAVVPMHLAGSRDEARANVRYGLQPWIDYFNNNLPRIFVPQGVDPVDFVIDTGLGVIGTPDDAVAMIERLLGRQPDIGCILIQENNWAPWDQTRRSFELYARYVMPYFDGANDVRRWSYDWVSAHQGHLVERRNTATREMFEKHAADRAARPADPAVPGT